MSHRPKEPALNDKIPKVVEFSVMGWCDSGSGCHREFRRCRRGRTSGPTDRRTRRTAAIGAEADGPSNHWIGGPVSLDEEVEGSGRGGARLLGVLAGIGLLLWLVGGAVLLYLAGGRSMCLP